MVTIVLKRESSLKAVANCLDNLWWNCLRIKLSVVFWYCVPLKAVANCLDNLWWNCLRIKLSVVFWYCVPVRIKLFVVFWYCVPLKAVANCLDNLWWNCLRIKLSVVFWYCVPVRIKLFVVFWYCVPLKAVANCLDNLWWNCLRIKLSVVFWYCVPLKAVANCLDNLWWNCLRIKLSVVFWYCVPVRIKLFVVFWYCVPLKAVANCLDNLWRSCLRIKLSVVFWYCILERSPRRVVGRKAHELSCGNETLLRVTPEGPESIEISESNWTTNREIGNIRPLEADKVQQISRPEAWLKFDRLADFGSAARLDMLKRNYLGYLKTLCLVETIDSWRTILAIHSQQTSIDLKTLRSVEKILHAAQKPICRLFGGFDRLFCRTAEHAPARSYIRSFYPRIVTSRPWCWFVDILAQERDISSDSSRLEAGHDYIQPSRPRIVPSGGQLYRALAAKDSWPPPGRNANPTPIALALAN
ncbi:hypothetical protein C8F04DRAFT_1192815 [Mycena alexandri]|uniref:Uncharacterized protein n=1 Tax=Mycena alexandri TaxID=1745969 RepID=A0AAD6SBB4_9AGAR|nr:hypothetical protein C8F04DRAFT_1192815 [Mycena alexandri]